MRNISITIAFFILLISYLYFLYLYLYQGMCSKQGQTLRELCLHFRLRTFR